MTLGDCELSSFKNSAREVGFWVSRSAMDRRPRTSFGVILANDVWMLLGTVSAGSRVYRHPPARPPLPAIAAKLTLHGRRELGENWLVRVLQTYLDGCFAAYDAVCWRFERAQATN